MHHPEARLCWKDYILYGYSGDEVSYTWDYAVFESTHGEAITPSMYHFMASYVESNFTAENMHDIACHTYCFDRLEEDAVDAYYEIPILDRIRMHKQELENLYNNKRVAEQREAAAIDAMLDEHRPFDDSSPIARDYSEFMRGIIKSSRDRIKLLDNMINEEENWHYESEMEQPLYDHSDEV